MSDIVIVAGARTPMGGFQGSLAGVSAVDLGAVVIREAVQRAGIAAEDVQEVIMGCVLPAGLKQGPARQAALAAGLPAATGCTTINKLCGSGMKAVMLAHDLLKAGTNQVMVAGGMESMSNAPYVLEKARSGLRMGHGEIKDHMFLDGLEDARTGRLMGSFAQETADKYGVTREEMDAYAIESLKRAQAAIADGSLAAEIVPVTVTSRKGESVVKDDEQPLTANLEKIPSLRPAFRKDGTITAANARLDLRRRLRAGPDDRRGSPAPWPEAAGANRRPCHPEPGPERVHPGADRRDDQPVRQDRLEQGRRRPVRDQRSLRHGHHARHARTRPRSCQGQCLWRRLRPGPSGRFHRLADHPHPDQRPAPERRQARRRLAVHRRRRSHRRGARTALIRR